MVAVKDFAYLAVFETIDAVNEPVKVGVKAHQNVTLRDTDEILKEESVVSTFMIIVVKNFISKKQNLSIEKVLVF